jgi:hypothetical protein
MNKALTYSSFAILSIIVVWIFVTSQSYQQLAVATILYVPVVYYGLRIFPRKRPVSVSLTIDNEMPQIGVTTDTNGTQSQSQTNHQQQQDKPEVVDSEKRDFLKFLGGAGLSFIVLSLLNRKPGSLFKTQSDTPEVVSIGNSIGQKVDPAESQPTDGYKISEIDDSEVTYYGFTNKNGAWFFIKVDTENGSFRYTRGESDFSRNWQYRKDLEYDYYSNVFK